MEKKTGNNEGQEKIVSLLNKKSELFERIFGLTNTFSTTLSNQTAENYIYLMELRQNLFDDIVLIDSELKVSGFEQSRLKSALSSGSSAVTLNINNKIKNFAEQTIKLDKSMSGTVNKMMDEIKSNIKNMSESKNVSNAYVNAGSVEISRFDKSK